MYCTHCSPSFLLVINDIEVSIEVVLYRWTCAFKHTYYKLIAGEPAPDVQNPHNVFVCGDDAEAVQITMALVDKLPGFKALFAGDLKYTRIVELLSPLWLAQLERDNYGLEFRCGWRFGP